MLLALEVLQSRVVSMLPTGTATGATPEGGAHHVVESTLRTTRVTARGSPAMEVVTKTEKEETAPPREKGSNSRESLHTLADGATRLTLYVDDTAAGPHTPTHHAER